MMASLERAKLFFGKPGLFENFAECSGRQATWMHGHVGLSAVGMAQDLMAATLSHFYKSSTQQLGQNLTGGVRHLRSRSALSAIWIQRESFRRETAFPRPTPRSILERQQWLLRRLPREWSGRESEYARNNNPETQVRLWAQEARNNA
jgi:hypothetical protein